LWSGIPWLCLEHVLLADARKCFVGGIEIELSVHLAQTLPSRYPRPAAPSSTSSISTKALPAPDYSCWGIKQYLHSHLS
jgi:hypothetical protein